MTRRRLHHDGAARRRGRLHAARQPYLAGGTLSLIRASEMGAAAGLRHSAHARRMAPSRRARRTGSSCTAGCSNATAAPPRPGILVFAYPTDRTGIYDAPRRTGRARGRLRGSARTGTDGRFEFTERSGPGRNPGRRNPAHIHLGMPNTGIARLLGLRRDPVRRRPAGDRGASGGVHTRGSVRRGADRHRARRRAARRFQHAGYGRELVIISRRSMVIPRPYSSQPTSIDTRTLSTGARRQRSGHSIAAITRRSDRPARGRPPRPVCIR